MHTARTPPVDAGPGDHYYCVFDACWAHMSLLYMARSLACICGLVASCHRCHCGDGPCASPRLSNCPRLACDSAKQSRLPRVISLMERDTRQKQRTVSFGLFVGEYGAGSSRFFGARPASPASTRSDDCFAFDVHIALRGLFNFFLLQLLRLRATPGYVRVKFLEGARPLLPSCDIGWPSGTYREAER